MIADAIQSTRDAVARGAGAGAAAARAHVPAGPRFGRLSRFFGRMGMARTTGLLTLGAVVIAEAMHMALAAVRGVTINRGMTIEIAIVATGVALPFIIYAQHVIRKLGGARRAEMMVAQRLALALGEAEQANRSKSDFLANMSHELRTPLNAVIGFSEVIRDQHFGAVANPRYVEYAGDINDSAQHLLSIIDDVLDLSRIQAGHASAQVASEFAVADVLAASARMIRPLVERERLSLTVADCPRTLRLLAPERLVRQALLNVMGNAAKFTPAGGRIAVGVALRDGGCELTVADTGVGMSPAQIVTAMEPFGRVENPLSARHPGTGLGLPLARAMIELQGGTLHIESEPARGTTVFLRFPAARVLHAVFDPPAT